MNFWLKKMELEKCKADFFYFAQYIKILHPVKGLIPLELFEYQKRYIQHLEDNQYTIATKFRQGGFTTLTDFYLFWKAAFNPDVHCMVYAEREREAWAHSDLLRRMWKELPESVQPKIKKHNDHRIEFENGSAMYFSTPGASKGRRLDYIHIDEAAFHSDLDRHWKAMYPMLMGVGKVIVPSTTNRASGWFHDVYQDAKKGRNSFSVFECSHTEHPDYANEEWVRRMQECLGPIGFKCEVLQEFLPRRLPECH